VGAIRQQVVHLGSGSRQVGWGEAGRRGQVGRWVAAGGDRQTMFVQPDRARLGAVRGQKALEFCSFGLRG
jgi:hypothetical protein